MYIYIYIHVSSIRIYMGFNILALANSICYRPVHVFVGKVNGDPGLM